jgi:phytoene desaturase
MGNTLRGKKVVVVGSGFSGLSAACHLAKAGAKVLVLEKNEQAGGRARLFEEKGYRFDMGPSWYWMPDVFDKFFKHFGKTTDDYYNLIRLNPSYQVIFGKDDKVNIPANMQELYALFESIEEGSSKQLEAFLKDAAFKYEVGMNDLVYTSGSSMTDYLNMKVFKGLMKTDILTPFSKYARKYFTNPKLLQIIEFPVLFLGSTPSNIPALHSLMNYADMQLGTWYPMGGMHKIVEAMTNLALSLGAEFIFNSAVDKIISENGEVKKVKAGDTFYDADYVIASADYEHVEQNLLDKENRKYDAKYWDKRVMAPSCLIYYVGVSKKIKNLQHHNLFFDADMSIHANEIYTNPSWPSQPLFYVSCPSKTDASVAPQNCENLFLLIPVAPGLKDTEVIKQQYFEQIMKRLEEHTGESILPFIEYQRSYAQSNFIEDYNAFKGNAYGLANTLMQTAFLKPSLKSKKVKNLYYTGQLTVPGPGVPPAIISGEIVATEILKTIKTKQHEAAI